MKKARITNFTGNPITNIVGTQYKPQPTMCHHSGAIFSAYIENLICQTADAELGRYYSK